MKKTLKNQLYTFNKIQKLLYSKKYYVASNLINNNEIIIFLKRIFYINR